MCSSDCFLAVIAILFPPLPVWVKRGICSADSIINIALCMLGFLPGLLHAWYIISKYPDPFAQEAYAYVPVDGEAAHPRLHHPAPRGCHHHHHHQAHAHQHRQLQQPPRQSGPVYGQHQPPPPPPPPEGEGYGSFNVTPVSAPPPGHSQAGGGASSGAPPSYASVVKGDNKVQHD